MRLLKLYVKEIMRWAYWGPVRLIVRFVPRSLSYRVAGLLGRVACLLSRGRCAAMQGWMATVTDAPVDGAEAYAQYFRNSIDTLLYGRLSPANIDDEVQYEGLEHLNAALAEGRGALVLYPHFGNEEFLMPALGHKLAGTRVHQIASRWEPEYVKGHPFVNAIRRHAWQMRIGTRESLPVGFVYIDGSVRDIYRLLKRNEVMLLAIDGREGSRWLEVPYLGRTAKISSGPMRLALSTGAPVLPAVIVRTGLWRHRLVIMPKLALEAGGGDEAVRAGTIAALKCLEPYIRQYPAQYAKFMMLDIDMFEYSPIERDA